MYVCACVCVPVCMFGFSKEGQEETVKGNKNSLCAIMYVVYTYLKPSLFGVCVGKAIFPTSCIVIQSVCLLGWVDVCVRECVGVRMADWEEAESIKTPFLSLYLSEFRLLNFVLSSVTVFFPGAINSITNPIHSCCDEPQSQYIYCIELLHTGNVISGIFVPKTQVKFLYYDSRLDLKAFQEDILHSIQKKKSFPIATKLYTNTKKIIIPENDEMKL